ncbi:MAG: DUF4372 domain-containing protein [Burkholderiales bacterium]|jgi:hypothetical protein|nr:DUF4372 domain-containing protein [Burkholderiales bacterium]MCA3153799.1 DUF4372 domain-containing protein [Burkholderiales bacterium]MCA3156663.1 DUF4372 domain-containing protein [Burkholderiales bacterium]MCA3169005.1 DUF4372 domain-containing protein [Burkholderiales bacterium]
MNVGKTLFAQIMEFVPWKNFGRIIERHRGDAGVPDCQSGQAVPHGFEECTGALHAVGCAEPARLAHLSCIGDAPHHARKGSLRTRAARLAICSLKIHPAHRIQSNSPLWMTSDRP